MGLAVSTSVTTPRTLPESSTAPVLKLSEAFLAGSASVMSTTPSRKLKLYVVFASSGLSKSRVMALRSSRSL